MSDLGAAAAALGVPESLVERSVAARASASGVSVDELLTEWAGGQAAPKPAAAPAPSAPAEDAAPDDDAAGATDVADTAPPPPPPIAAEAPPPPVPVATAPAGPYRPPTLVGARDNPMLVVAGAIGLFLIVVMVGLVGPSLPVDNPGARTSEIAFSDDAVAGRDIYATAGCVSCHTQMVRPIVADVGLGAVTLNDTNQILGIRRFGPDLSDVGSRLTGSQIEAIVGGLGSHPAHNLSGDDMTQLVAYLVESASLAPAEEGS
jgi:cytochrome c oxidase cbb3-type subunit 2